MEGWSMTKLRFKVLAPLYVCLNMVFAADIWADGMRPETTVIVLNESEGEVSINVTNTDKGPA